MKRVSAAEQHSAARPADLDLDGARRVVESDDAPRRGFRPRFRRRRGRLAPNPARFERKRRLEFLACRVRGERVADRLPRSDLERRIDARLHDEAALARALSGDLLEHFLHLRDDFGGELRFAVRGRCEAQRNVPRDLPRLRREKALLEHLIEHETPPGERLVRVVARRVTLRRRNEPGERGDFLEIELARLLAEIVTRGFFDAVAAVSEIDVIEIERKDLVLGERLLEAACKDRFLDLPLVAALGAEDDVLDDLLRDGARALLRTTGPEIHEQRPHHAEVIEPLVLVERLRLRLRGTQAFRVSVSHRTESPCDVR